MRYLTACCIVKDEDPRDMRDWLDFHLRVGVEHFVLYDHASRVPLRDVLRDYVVRGLVDVVPVRGPAMQLPAYAHCLDQFGRGSRWIAFIDADEFIVPRNERDLRLVLAEYEQFAGLAVHWLIFGTSGHVERPCGPQWQHFLWRLPREHPDNRHVKSIVDPARTIVAATPHGFVYRAGERCVDERGRQVDGALGAHTSERLQLNHYFTRSLAQYRDKMRRGCADGAKQRLGQRLVNYDRQATEEDRTIIEVIAELGGARPIGLTPGPDRPGEQMRPHAVIESGETLELARLRNVADAAMKRSDWVTCEAALRFASRRHPDNLGAAVALIAFYEQLQLKDHAWSELCRGLCRWPTARPLLLRLRDRLVRRREFKRVGAVQRLLDGAAQ